MEFLTPEQYRRHLARLIDDGELIEQAIRARFPAGKLPPERKIYHVDPDDCGEPLSSIERVYAADMERRNGKFVERLLAERQGVVLRLERLVARLKGKVLIG